MKGRRQQEYFFFSFFLFFFSWSPRSAREAVVMVCVLVLCSALWMQNRMERKKTKRESKESPIIVDGALKYSRQAERKKANLDPLWQCESLWVQARQARQGKQARKELF